MFAYTQQLKWSPGKNWSQLNKKLLFDNTENINLSSISTNLWLSIAVEEIGMLMGPIIAQKPQRPHSHQQHKHPVRSYCRCCRCCSRVPSVNFWNTLSIGFLLVAILNDVHPRNALSHSLSLSHGLWSNQLVPDQKLITHPIPATNRPSSSSLVSFSNAQTPTWPSRS